jgi:hypothetical protein
MPRKRESAPTTRRSLPPADRLDVDALAASQGVQPVSSPEELAADFWPADETADEFIASVRRWRREDGNGAAKE